MTKTRESGKTAQDGVVLALGVFDGVHAGHKYLLSIARKDADDMGLPLHVYTFYEHPAAVLQGKPVPSLTTIEQKIGLLATSGMDCLHLEHFTPEFADMTYAEFIDMLREDIGMRHLVIGQGAAFGRDNLGSVSRLAEEADELGITLRVVPPVTAGGVAISSSRIRLALAHGDIEYANACLGRPYTLSGTIQHGDSRGHTLGFPTANLRPASGMLIPATGVYLTRVQLAGEKEPMQAMTNIGVHPTVDELTEPMVETFILDFEGDIYGQNVEIELLMRLRDERAFGSIDALKEQIDKDVLEARQYFSKLG
ncbi:MAG: bifunctional riboflavin kinase/FAD synthetase [Christensenellales bacterium]|jgi:riboflavin kinase/FMN adenylyltransferase